MQQRIYNRSDYLLDEDQVDTNIILNTEFQEEMRLHYSQDLNFNFENHVLCRKIFDLITASFILEELGLNSTYAGIWINGLTPDWYDGEKVVEVKVKYNSLSNRNMDNVRNKIINKYYFAKIVRPVILTPDQKGTRFLSILRFNYYFIFTTCYKRLFGVKDEDSMVEGLARQLPMTEELNNFIENFDTGVVDFHKERVFESLEILKSIKPMLMDGEDAKKIMIEFVEEINKSALRKVDKMTRLPLNIKTKEYTKCLGLPTLKHDIDKDIFKCFNDAFPFLNLPEINEYQSLLKLYNISVITKTAPTGYRTQNELFNKLKLIREELNIKMEGTNIKMSARGTMVTKLDRKRLLKLGFGLNEKLKSMYNEDSMNIHEIMEKKYNKLLDKQGNIPIKDYTPEMEEFFDNCIFEPNYSVEFYLNELHSNSNTDDYLRMGLTDAENYINDILENNKYIRCMRAMREIYESIAANYDMSTKNRTEEKGVRANIFYVKSLKLGCVILPGDKQYTGSISFIGIAENFIKKKYFNKVNLFNVNGLDYFITKPFSIPNVYLTDYLRNFGSSLATYIAWDQFKMKPNSAVMSLFVDTRMEHTDVLDVCFYLIKNGGFTLGKLLLKEKLQEIQFKSWSVATWLYAVYVNYEQFYPLITKLYTKEIVTGTVLKVLGFQLKDKMQHTLWAWMKNNMTKDFLKSLNQIMIEQWKKNIKYKDDYKGLPVSFMNPIDGNVNNFFNRKYNFSILREQIYTDGVFNSKASYLPGAITEMNNYTSKLIAFRIPELRVFDTSFSHFIVKNKPLTWSTTSAMKDSIETGKVKSVNVLEEAKWEFVDLMTKNSREAYEVTGNYIDFDFMKKKLKENKENWEKRKLEINQAIEKSRKLTNLEVKSHINDESFLEFYNINQLDEIDPVVDIYSDFAMENLIDNQYERIQNKSTINEKKAIYRAPRYFKMTTSKVKTYSLFKICEIMAVTNITYLTDNIQIDYKVNGGVKLLPLFKNLKGNTVPMIVEIMHNAKFYPINTISTGAPKKQIGPRGKRMFSVMNGDNRATAKVADEIGNQKLLYNKHSNITIGGNNKYTDFQKDVTFVRNWFTGVTEDAAKHGERVTQEVIMEKSLSDFKLNKITLGQLKLILMASASMYNRKVIVPVQVVQSFYKGEKFLSENTFYSGTQQGEHLKEKLIETQNLLNSYKSEESGLFYKDEGKPGYSTYTENYTFSSFIGYPLGVMSLNATDAHATVGQTIEMDSILIFGKRLSRSKQHSDDSFDWLWEILEKLMILGLDEVLYQNFLKDIARCLITNWDILNESGVETEAVLYKKMKKMVFLDIVEKDNTILGFNGRSYPGHYWTVYSFSQRLLLSRCISVTPSGFKYNICRAVIEMIQVQVAVVNKGNQTIIDVLSPMNKHLDSIGGSDKCYSYKMAVTQRMGMLMEGSLHNMPSELFNKLILIVNYLSAYDFRIPKIFSDLPLQFGGMYISSIGMLHEFGLMSNFLRNMGIRRSRNAISHLVANKTTKARNPNVLVDDINDHSFSTKIRDFQIRVKIDKNLEKDYSKLLNFGEVSLTLTELENELSEELGLQYFLKPHDIRSKVLKQIQSAKTGEAMKTTLRHYTSRKLGYYKQLVEWGEEVVTFMKLQEMAFNFQFKESNDMIILEKLYRNEIQKYNNLDITFEGYNDEKEEFIGTYKKIKRDDFKYGDWKIYEPFFYLAMEIGIEIGNITELNYFQKVIATETAMTHPEILKLSNYIFLTDTVQFLMDAGYIGEKLNFKNLSKDLEFIKSIFQSKIKPALIKLGGNGLTLIDRDENFYNNSVSLRLSVKTKLNNLIEIDTLQTEIELKVSDRDLTNILSAYLEFNLVHIQFRIGNNIITSDNYEDVLGRRFSEILSQKYITATDCNITSYLQLTAVPIVRFGFCLIKGLKLDTENMSKRKVYKVFYYQLPCINIHGYTVALGYGRHFRELKTVNNELTVSEVKLGNETTEKFEGVKKSLFIVTDYKGYNNMTVITLTYILSYFCNSVLKTFYKENKGRNINDIVTYLVKYNFNPKNLNKVRRGDCIYSDKGEIIKIDENIGGKIPLYFEPIKFEEYSRKDGNISKGHSEVEDNFIVTVNTEPRLVNSSINKITNQKLFDFSVLHDKYRDVTNAYEFNYFFKEITGDLLNLEWYIPDKYSDEDILFITFIECCTSMDIRIIMHHWIVNKNYFNNGDNHKVYLDFLTLGKNITTNATSGVTIEMKLECLKNIILKEISGQYEDYMQEENNYSNNDWYLKDYIELQYTRIPKIIVKGDNELFDTYNKDRLKMFSKLIPLFQLNSKFVSNHPLYSAEMLYRLWHCRVITQSLSDILGVTINVHFATREVLTVEDLNQLIYQNVLNEVNDYNKGSDNDDKSDIESEELEDYIPEDF